MAMNFFRKNDQAPLTVFSRSGQTLDLSFLEI